MSFAVIGMSGAINHYWLTSGPSLGGGRVKTLSPPPPSTIDFVHMTLVADWSHEQISEVGEHINCPVSHEWIYRYVARDKANGGTLYRHLR